MQLELNQQASARADKADRELNAIYRLLIKHEDPASAKKLRVAERAWIAFRDAEADYESSSYIGGSIYPLEYSTAYYELTTERVKRLKKVYKDEVEM